jgi:hypothetical protein
LRAVAHLGMSGDGWTESKKANLDKIVRAKEAAEKVRTEKESNTSGAKAAVFSICYGTLGNTNFNPLQWLSRGIPVCSGDSQQAVLNGRLAWYGATSEVVT